MEILRKASLPLTTSALLCALVVSGILYAESPVRLLAQKESIEENTPAPQKDETLITPPQENVTQEESAGEAVIHEENNKYVLVELDKMTLSLMGDGKVLETMPLITQGKPGSYYETIGGNYTHDYKIKTHFSSIGHVYMPWSIHVFGNFFLHGIPYYPDGTKVSSAYSGGCVRMADEDAKKVYDFVKPGMPIIITREGGAAFSPSNPQDATKEDMDMTREMSAAISLEVLPQDNTITGPDGEETTRRKLLPKLLVEKDDRISKIYVQALGEKVYVDYMNKKARAIGLSNTTFTSVSKGASTTEEDAARFAHYLDTYKTYIRTVEAGKK